MRNLSIILNVVLLIAVGVLYYLHFSQPKSTSVAEPTATSQEETQKKSGDTLKSFTVPKITTTGDSGKKVVFVNYEEISKKYEFVKKIEAEINAKIESAEKELASKEAALREKFISYQNNAPNMTDGQRKFTEEQLQKDEESLYEMKRNLEMQMMKQQQNLNERLLNNLYGYFSKVAKENNFSYILSYQRGIPGVLYGEPALDITNQLIEGLNKEYRKK